MKGLTDQFVDDLGPVELGRVYVIDARIDCRPEDAYGFIPIPGGPEDVRTGQPHCSEPDRRDREGAKRPLP